MKILVVLSAVAAVAFASVGPIAPGLLAAPGLRYLAGAPLAYSSPLAYSYSAPLAYSAYSAYAAAPAIAAAPALAAAPAIAYSAAPAPVAVAAAPAAVAVAAPAVRSQYHAQDELGNAAFGHSEPGQVHTSVQDAAGNRVGSFSYLNPTDGQIHRTDYVADAAGYRVAANDLPVAPAAAPVPVADTPEVVAARAAHLAAHSRARRSAVLLQTPASTAPLATRLALAAPAPIAYSAPLAAPLAYSAPLAAPIAYSAAAPAITYSAVPAGIPATLTTIVNNPGHAVSYRVD